jgi:steroid 5-alpha reductase family enzyme
MSNDGRAVLVAYLVALAVAVQVGLGSMSDGPVHAALWADVAATVVVFLFSVLYRNSSFYDAYWSVAPIAIVMFWGVVANDDVPSSRQALVTLLVFIWGVRLTWNWARGWEGLHHEDWRYVMLAQRTGLLRWPVSFAGIHMLPTLVVFAGCLPLWSAVGVGTAPLGWLDGLAFAVTLGAIAVEALADQQLRAYRLEPHTQGDFLRSGLWAWSRHPNYLGEIGFWWGLALFGLAAAPGFAWNFAGAIAITLLFRFISLPMIEGRMRERRPEYAAWAARTSLLLPRPPREG